MRELLMLIGVFRPRSPRIRFRQGCALDGDGSSFRPRQLSFNPNLCRTLEFGIGGRKRHGAAVGGLNKL